MKENHAMLQGITNNLPWQQVGLTCKENAVEISATRVRARKGGLPSQSQSLAVSLPPPGLTLEVASVSAAGDVPMDVQGVESSPLPALSWAHSGNLWRQMRAKDRMCASPDSDLRLRHPGILPNMRTILLDWLMEVS